MTNEEFHGALCRIRWLHWLHYPVQGLLMGSTLLVSGAHAAVGQTVEPRLATWPALLVLGALVPTAGLLIYACYRRLRPNLRRPPEGNLRIYQARILLRNSLLALVPLPLLASYVLTHRPFDLVAAGGMLLALGWRLTPTPTTYQRWLLS